MHQAVMTLGAHHNACLYHLYSVQRKLYSWWDVSWVDPNEVSVACQISLLALCD